MKRERNTLHWLEEEYLAQPPYLSNVKPDRLANQRPDKSYRCCGGFGEHFADCKEPCCYCGEGFDSEARWPRRRVAGANGYPAHSGCEEQHGMDAL